MSEAELAQVRTEMAELRRRAEGVEKVMSFLQRGWEAATLDRQRKAILALLDAPELLEELAAIEHHRWSGWEDYRATKAGKQHPNGELYEERWKRLRALPYSSLTEAERASDRVEVAKTLVAIKAFLIEAWNREEGGPS